MKITFHGHSVLSIALENGENLIIDPFITGNPVTDLTADEVQADWILVTHGHSDHFGDTVPIAKRNDATVVSVVEVCHYAASQGVAKTHGMNIGGSHDFPFGKVTLVHAQHSAGLETESGMVYMGVASGILLQAEGKTIYHAGDTSEFGDMDLIGELYDIDIAFLPIGDNFTMDPKAAVRAAKRLQAKKVVPIHYNTFPLIQQDGHKFVSSLPESVGQLLNVGESIKV